MTNSTYVRLRQRNVVLQKRYGGKVTFNRPAQYGRNDAGEEILIPGSGNATVYGTLTKLDVKYWGEASINPGDVEYSLAALTLSGEVLSVNIGDNVTIDGITYRVAQRKYVKPDGSYLIGVRVILEAL
ncbi:MAG: hypothetical protein WBP82_07440 [Leuconostoc mesenteroides]